MAAVNRTGESLLHTLEPLREETPANAFTCTGVEQYKLFEESKRLGTDHIRTYLIATPETEAKTKSGRK